MKVLKKKFKKKKILQTPRILKKIIKEPKIGRWCSYYEGRLPFPIECSHNKTQPVTKIFKDGKSTIIKNTPNCVNCTRNPEFLEWKKGEWDKVKEAIINGEDLRDMDPPMRRK